MQGCALPNTLCCRLSCWLHQGTPPSFISLACRLCQCTWYFGGSAGFLRPALLQHFQDIFSQSARADSFACTCTLPFRAFSATASLPRKFVQRVSRSSPFVSNTTPSASSIRFFSHVADSAPVAPQSRPESGSPKRCQYLGARIRVPPHRAADGARAGPELLRHRTISRDAPARHGRDEVVDTPLEGAHARCRKCGLLPLRHPNL